MTLLRALLGLLVLALLAPSAHAEDESPAASRVRGGGNRLSKRTELRYEDVLTTHDGTRWHGKIVAEGNVFRIRLEDGSVVAVPQAEVASITRELAPGFPHTGQWGTRVGIGGEVAVVASETNAGVQYGGLVEAALTHNFRGSFEPELVAVLTPVGPQDGVYQWQLAFGFRYYLVPFRKAKPWTETQIIFAGMRKDLGIRTGPGMMFDLAPNFGVGVSQGVTLISQANPKATAVGYHVLVNAQGRF